MSEKEMLRQTNGVGVGPVRLSDIHSEIRVGLCRICKQLFQRNFVIYVSLL
jgi:hypothetical protein